MSLRKVLVTGSDGFLGKALTKRINGAGLFGQRIDLKQGTDVADWDQVKKLRGFQTIIHLAPKHLFFFLQPASCFLPE